MSPIDAGSLLIDRDVQLAETAPTSSMILASDADSVTPFDERWQRAVERLRDWIVDPRALDHDEIEVPSPAVIWTAALVLRALRRKQASTVFFPVPDAVGGVSFERKRGALFEEYRLAKDGELSYRRYVDGTLVHKAVINRIPLAPMREPM